MSQYNPELVRAVAIELKAAVADLYADVLPVYVETAQWTLHCQNAALPDPFSVRVAVEQYQALKIQTLELRTWIATVKTAQADDTYTYTDPCGGTLGLLIPEAGFMVPESGLTIYP